LVALLTFNTGLPSLQQMGDAMFHLGFGGQTGGWHFENRHTLEREIWNHEIHTYPNRRVAAVPDWFAVLVPKSIEPSKVLTTYASANLLSYHLGLLGERWVKDTAKSVAIDFDGVRTIYRNEIWVNGDVTELAITGSGFGFNFFTEMPVDLSSNPTTNQLVCQPGARWYQRLFTHLDPAANHGVTNSLCSLFGQVQVASAAGSAVEGLTGYAAAVPDETVAVLHREIANQYTSVWNSAHATPLADRRIEPDFIRIMAERNRGDDNLHFTEAGLRIAFIDQDLFDRDTAVDSALEHIQNGNMWLGPCPSLVVYDQAGQVVHEVTTVYELVGSGQAASPTVSSPDPVQEVAPSESTAPGPESETPEKIEGKEEADDPQL